MREAKRHFTPQRARDDAAEPIEQARLSKAAGYLNFLPKTSLRKLAANNPKNIGGSR